MVEREVLFGCYQDKHEKKVQGNLFIIFHHKLKQVNSALTKQSKTSFGNIFKKLLPWRKFLK